MADQPPSKRVRTEEPDWKDFSCSARSGLIRAVCGGVAHANIRAKDVETMPLDQLVNAAAVKAYVTKALEDREIELQKIHDDACARQAEEQRKLRSGVEYELIQEVGGGIRDLVFTPKVDTNADENTTSVYVHFGVQFTPVTKRTHHLTVDAAVDVYLKDNGAIEYVVTEATGKSDLSQYDARLDDKRVGALVGRILEVLEIPANVIPHLVPATFKPWIVPEDEDDAEDEDVTAAVEPAAQAVDVSA